MEWVAIVIGLALVEYSVFVWWCGQARGRQGVPAPSTVGDPIYERYYRIQMNTVEQLVLFLPCRVPAPVLERVDFEGLVCRHQFQGVELVCTCLQLCLPDGLADLFQLLSECLCVFPLISVL